MKKNNMFAFVGGLLGALLGTIPWVLMYVYGGYILSILAAIVALASYKGYLLFGGAKKKNTAILIVALSVLAITFSTFVTIPFLLNIKNGYGFSIEAFKNLYLNDRFVSAIIGDYLLSLLFTFLGISGVVANIKNDPEDFKQEDFSEEEVNKIFAVFENHQALSKKNTMTKWEFEKEVDPIKNHDLIQNLKRKRVIVGGNKLYLDKRAYTDLEYASSLERKQRGKAILIFVFSILLLIFLLAVLTKTEDNTNNNNNNNSNTSTNNQTQQTDKNYKEYKLLNYASYQLPEYLVVYEDNTSEEYFQEKDFYSITYTPLKSYRGDPSFVTVFVDYIPDYYYDNFSEYKEYIFSESDDKYQVEEVNLLENVYKYEAIEIIAKSSDGRLYHDYYLYYKGDSLFFEFISDTEYQIDEFKKEVQKVLKSATFEENIDLQKS